MFLGGLGFITAVTFLLTLVGHRFSLREMVVLRENLGTSSFRRLVHLTLHVLILDLLITIVGAAILYWRFADHYAAPQALWQAVFTAVSAFNTAGFDIVGPASLAPFQTDFVLLSAIIGVACLGAIGYTELVELSRFKRVPRRLSLNTRLVIIMSLAAWLVGSVAILVNEGGNAGTLGPLGSAAAAGTAAFNGISAATTTGFSTVDFGKASEVIVLFTVGLMFIGGAAGSTAGGIKLNTVGVLLAAAISSFKGRPQAELFRREIAYNQIARAISILLLAIGIVSVTVLTLVITEPAIPFPNLLFETVSAFGTVGLSTGALAAFSVAGKYLIIALMFIGRLGVLSLILALSAREQPSLVRYPEETVKLA